MNRDTEMPMSFLTAADEELLARLDIAARALAEGRTPLEVMIEAMNDAYAAGGAAAAMPYAREVAPYLHPRLSAVHAQVEDPISRILNAIPAADLAALEAALRESIASGTGER